jgi:omega-6 fatty acid desaturase (delta-12 desaturase)
MNSWGEWFMQFMVITPIDWSKKHKIHHGTSGDLNHGPTEWNDTIYFTTEQYWGLSPTFRTLYRIFRDPVFFFTVIPVLNWFVKYRIPFLEMLDRAQRASGLGVAKNSIVNTTGSVAVFYMVWKLFGTSTVIAYIFTVYLCMVVGVALFHLQHAFNPSYTTRKGWNLKDSAFRGSSILTIPQFLKPWTMGIEYHHIHHYSSIIPGYLLRQCHEEAPEGLWDGTHVLSYKDMYASLFYTLYDEPSGLYVSFKEADALEASRKKGGPKKQKK